jgi:hypothetical protein
MTQAALSHQKAPGCENLTAPMAIGRGVDILTPNFNIDKLGAECYISLLVQRKDSSDESKAIMFKTLAKKITASAYLAFARYRDRADIIDVGEYLSKIATALILPPEHPEAFKAATQLLDDLRQRFTQTQFYLLTPKALVDTLSLNEQVRIISYDPTEIGFHGLPKDTLQQAIRSRHFDMVIDLNLEFNLIATFLCRVSEAKLRICLAHPERDPFYNFQLRVTDGNRVAEKYQSLLKYISVFTDLLDRRNSTAVEMSLR